MNTGARDQTIDQQEDKEKGIWRFRPNPPSSTWATRLGGCVKVEDLPSSVIATLGANPMRQHLLFAIGTLHKMGRADGVVCATAVTSPLAQFTFW
jgi:hypothetical protein